MLEPLNIGSPNALATKNGLATKSESILTLTEVEINDYAERLAKIQEHLAELRPIYLDRYGFETLTDNEVCEIEQAEKELEQCRGCKGKCPKSVGKAYSAPMIFNYVGEMRISRPDCKYGVQRRLKSKCRLVSIPLKYAGKTFEDYEVTADNREAVQLAKWYAIKKPNRSLYFFGECGTGKTFLAALIAQEFIRDYKTVIFSDVPELLDEIKRTFDSDKESAQDVLE